MNLKKTSVFLFFALSVFLASCTGSNSTILNGLEEKEANVIVVFLESRGIKANKVEAKASGAGAENTIAKFNIEVSSTQSVSAMSLLNQNGLPQRHGTTLLELFAKSGFMSTDKEETIRYQAGLAQQLENVILMIDGVIDANVQLSFPDANEDSISESSKKFPTASVFVKHQGVFDDPNSHLPLKIKRLVSGSVQDMSIDNVTVVSDRSRFTDVSPADSLEVNPIAKADEQVRIWSITMNKNSTGKFRLFFFLLTGIIILFALLLGWIIWKVYPVIKEGGGFTKLFNLAPISPKVEKAATPIEPNTNNLPEE
ncbi:EscJ/YscJ/HrcJ family type III secretion inner membrane ring protein [bacterium]|nr:EscJ/YscJ/HrcJ family type III secretion inner membrane ring protein [bacterium]